MDERLEAVSEKIRMGIPVSMTEAIEAIVYQQKLKTERDAQRSKTIIGRLMHLTMNASREMPKYECHKKVWALKIAEITEPTDATGTSRTIMPADEGYGPFVVDGAYMAKHKPEAGGYYVVYEDGYKSFSPAGAFESGYTPL